MADRNAKLKDNVPGRFYVDKRCIDCDLCRMTAPANFARNQDAGFSFVFKQPLNPEEEKFCQQAKKECPVEAIGDDGE